MGYHRCHIRQGSDKLYGSYRIEGVFVGPYLQLGNMTAFPNFGKGLRYLIGIALNGLAYAVLISRTVRLLLAMMPTDGLSSSTSSPIDDR